MKKYFAKYRPVEEEIKEQPFIWFNNKVWEHWSLLTSFRDKTFLIPIGEKQGIHALISECKPAKLFLCSRDIKPEDYLKEGNVHIYYDGSEPPFKVIGEILTPGIVENQEFTEKEIKYLTIK